MLTQYTASQETRLQDLASREPVDLNYHHRRHLVALAASAVLQTQATTAAAWAVARTSGAAFAASSPAA